MPAELPAIKYVCFASKRSNLTIFRLMKFLAIRCVDAYDGDGTRIEGYLKAVCWVCQKEENHRVINNSIARDSTYKNIYGYQMRLRR